MTEVEDLARRRDDNLKHHDIKFCKAFKEIRLFCVWFSLLLGARWLLNVNFHVEVDMILRPLGG